MTETLPVAEALPALRRALDDARIAILTAPPGAGKSTLVPLELLGEPWLQGQRITMLEPRRLAARTVASRMASQLDESVGGTVGYRIRGEARVGRATRIEVVTEGVLTRTLLSQPDLAGCGLVIFDEFHERSIHADLGLALARRVQALFRPDLRILVMSATLDEAALSRLLDGAPVVTSAGRSFPIEIAYATEDLQIDRDPVPSVAAAIRRALRDTTGDILTFLPGKSEITRVAASLHDLSGKALDVRPLHGDLPIEAQQAAIQPGLRRRVVLATNIAETSLTIEGVGVVIDSGLARVSRFDSGLGMSRLDTVRIARDNADQRAGRAGRLGPGKAMRLWTERTQHALAASRAPEITDADLLPLGLDLAIWGEPDESLAWITPPQSGALAEARRILTDLGALADGTVTAHGRAIHEMGVHPRLGHLLIEGRRLGLGGLAADIAALLEERDILPRDAGADLSLRVEALRKSGRGGAGSARVREMARDHRSRLKLNARNEPTSLERVGQLVALAYPERVAQRRAGSKDRYRLASGRGVRLDSADPLTHEEWLAVAHVDARDTEGRIFLAAPLDIEGTPSTTHDVIAWDDARGVIVAQRERRVGELILTAKPLTEVPDELKVELLAKAIRSEGLLPRILPDAARVFQSRVMSLRTWGRDGFPDLSDAALLETLGDWLRSELLASRSRADLMRLEVMPAIESILSWNERRDLDRLAPQAIEAPTGSRIALQYFADGSSPVLAVRLQEVFGWIDTPTIDEGRTRVTLHLLSPARRPVQVTQDLKSFWTTTYPEVRRELRSRYPRHSWPDDPLTATPIRGPKRRGT